MLREVTVEERLVDADILVGANAFAFNIQLSHTVYQQERVAVRQVFANFVDVHHDRESLYQKKKAIWRVSGIR